MKSPSTEKQLLPDDLFTRFLFFKKTEVHLDERYIRTSAFSKTHSNGYSVFETTGLSHNDIWEIGKKYAAPSYEKQNPPRPMLGRFDLERKHYLQADLTIEKSEPPPKHYNIYGMPVPSTAQGKELSRRQILANEASKKLYLIKDNKDWEKYGTASS